MIVSSMSTSRTSMSCSVISLTAFRAIFSAFDGIIPCQPNPTLVPCAMCMYVGGRINRLNPLNGSENSYTLIWQQPKNLTG
jgi:hypothetical protein